MYILYGYIINSMCLGVWVGVELRWLDKLRKKL